MSGKLELTWYGKDEPVRVEPRLLIENAALDRARGNITMLNNWRRYEFLGSYRPSSLPRRSRRLASTSATSTKKSLTLTPSSLLKTISEWFLISGLTG